MDGEHGTDRSTAGSSAERIGRNEAIFRKANEGISAAAESEGIEDSVPFICECADPDCREVVHMSMEEYSAIREDPRLFLNVPGHQAAAQGWAQVVESHDRYLVCVKIGPAGDVAEQLAGDGSCARRRRGGRWLPPGGPCLRRPGESVDGGARARRNESLFRAINDRIEELNEAFAAVADDGFSVVCECDHMECVEQIPIAAVDYRRLRADPDLFIVLPGHEDAIVEAVVEVDEGAYVVVRKPPG